VRLDVRRTGLLIPEAELPKVAAAGVLEALHPVLDRCRLSVMTREIQVGRLSVVLVTDKRLQHADDFGTFLVDRPGVEIVDGDVGLWLYGMGKGAGILLKLPIPELAYVVDPLDRVRAHGGRKALVAEDCQALLQRKLEPVAAGNTIARPVVEIFVRYHAFD